jgi:leader peptidase (prepilin peptidase) / N-methyltransferase
LNLVVLAGLAAFGVGAGLAGDWLARRFEPRPVAGYVPGPLGAALAGALLGLLAGSAAPGATLSGQMLTAGFGWLLLALTLIDLRTFRLPDGLTLAVAALGAVMVWQTRPQAWAAHLIGGLAGYLVLVAVELGYRKLRGRDGLGRGDAKLFGAIGVWVSWTGLPLVMLTASAAGLIAALGGGMLRGQRPGGSTQIAFGPWLAAGGFAVWLAQWFG